MALVKKKKSFIRFPFPKLHCNFLLKRILSLWVNAQYPSGLANLITRASGISFGSHMAPRHLRIRRCLLTGGTSCHQLWKWRGVDEHTPSPARACNAPYGLCGWLHAQGLLRPFQLKLNRRIMWMTACIRYTAPLITARWTQCMPILNLLLHLRWSLHQRHCVTNRGSGSKILPGSGRTGLAENQNFSNIFLKKISWKYQPKF